MRVSLLEFSHGRTGTVRRALAVLFIAAFAFAAVAVDPPPWARAFDSLTVRGQTYTSVTVIDLTKRHIAFRSTEGFATVLIEDLDPGIQAKLKPGYQDVASTAPLAGDDKEASKGKMKVKARESGATGEEGDEDGAFDAPIEWTMRNITALCVLGIGALTMIAGRVLMICAGFRSGAMWGICLLVGGFLVDVMYCISHWETARRPVYIQLVALGVLAAGWALSLF